MSIIKLNVDNCQNCFKCIRECPLKAIEFKDNRTKIIESECVLCGTCMETCPRGAKYFRKNVEAVKELLRGDAPVCVSVAPSYTGWYNTNNFASLSKALKKLGFFKAEETAIGAAQVTEEYVALMKSGQMKNIIATSCSSVVMLVEKHYPQLLKMLAPVSSPMMAHARLIHEAYGDNVKVVFIGPCLSKMEEAQDPLAGGLVDEVITFDDLDAWLAEENIIIEEDDSDVTGVQNPTARLYPKVQGILDTIGKRFYDYTPISVDGIDRCMEVMDSLQNGDIQHVFIEANICPGACIGGPIMRMHNKSMLKSHIILSSEKSSIDSSVSPSAQIKLPHPRVFANRSVDLKMPTEEEIHSILLKIGKTTPEKELNCGSCGYATCREKAIAVYNGKADIEMCLPYLRERAENMSSTVIENSPNGIMTFDEDMNVTEINPKGEYLFGVTRAEIIGQMIPALYGETIFDDALNSDKVIVKQCFGATEDITVELSVLYLKGHNQYIAFAKDISDAEENKKELTKLRLATVDVAQSVIDKQMRVAQEIASLLGETTAETKVALTALKKSIKDISNVQQFFE